MKAVAKAMPAVVNINTESIVQRTVRDPMDALDHDFFGRAMRPPRTLQHKVPSPGPGSSIYGKGRASQYPHAGARGAGAKLVVQA